MKIYSKKIQAALIALMMFSSAMMMGACSSTDDTSFTDHAAETSDISMDYQDEDSSESVSREYTYEDSSTTNNYNYEYNTYEEYSSSDSSSPDYEDTGYEESYDDYEDCDFEDYDYEECDDEDYDYAEVDFDYDDEEQSDDTEECSSSYGISETDYARDAYVSTNDFDFTLLPVRIGGTNATIKADVINRSGKHITGVGCTLYYGNGSEIKSTLLSCDSDEESFGLQFDINRDLEEMLDRGGYYAYRIFVEADGVIYTHDSGYFFTNDIDDRIEIEEHVASVSTTSASVNVKVYNSTGATVEAIGCRFGDGMLLLSEDKVTGSFTDSEFDETFTFYAEDGEFPSGYKYTYEVYVICNGQEYTVGTCSFKAPVY